MKKRLYLLCLIHSIVLFCTGQSVPSLFNYQIAVRNAEGLPISNRLMSFQVSIADNLNGSNPIFIETYNYKTNNNGIANFQIGLGKAVGSVSLNEIPFLQHDYYISIAVDTNNGNNYIPVSTTQLISVPYALASDSSGYAYRADQLAQNGAKKDQVLKWDDATNSWKPSNDETSGTAGDDWGNQVVNTTSPIEGKGTSSEPLKLGHVGAQKDQILQWNGNTWVPTSDKIGLEKIATQSPITGEGTSSSLLRLIDGTSNGQILKWNGNQWVLGNDSLGLQTYFAGKGIAISNGEISNTGDVIASDDITQSTDATTDLSGKFPHLSVIKLRGAGISPILPKNDQILQYINNQWTPSTVTLSNGWGLSGNIVNFGNFIGSVNDEDIVFKRENMKSGLLSELNTSWGYRSFESNFLAIGEGIYNTAIGTFSLTNNSSGIHNTAVGNSSLQNNGTGYGNSAFGSEALYYNTIGYENTAIGRNSLSSNSSGSANLAVGYEAMNYNSSGKSNNAVGWHALFSNTTGYSNTAMGYEAIGINKIGSQNTGIGNGSLYMSTGERNTAIGFQSLNQLTTGNNNSSIGFLANVGMGNLSNSTSIGTNAIVTASNNVWIGGTGTLRIGGPLGWNQSSDGRFKENVQSNLPGISFINLLNPVSYTMNIDRMQHHITAAMPDSIAKKYYPTEDQISRANKSVQSGFIAQEVEEAAKKVGYEFDGVTPPQNATDTYSIAYSQFVPSIVKAIQEQQAMIESQNKTIEALNVKIADLDQLKVKLVVMESELAKIKEILLKNEK